jgi:hypothetical protein
MGVKGVKRQWGVRASRPHRAGVPPVRNRRAGGTAAI